MLLPHVQTFLHLQAKQRTASVQCLPLPQFLLFPLSKVSEGKEKRRRPTIHIPVPINLFLYGGLFFSIPSVILVMADPGESRETQMPVITPSMFPGFRFSPTDVELISYYLKNKLSGSEKSVEIIPEVEICRYEPWDLPGQSFMTSDNEWYFFCSRGRKYPNGSQSKRATTQGYWKATGKERNVKSGSTVVGTKRTLVFHIGRAPKGERTEWIMHEYCMEGKSQDLVVCRLRKNAELRSSSSRAPLNQGHSNVDDTMSEGGMEQTSHSEKEKAFELSEKHHASSYDSQSVENVDSATESEKKFWNETTFAGPSTPGQWDPYEDCFSEILKDDIIKLDETTLSAPEHVPVVASKYEPVPAVATRYEPERFDWQPVQEGAMWWQGTTLQRPEEVCPGAEPRLIRAGPSSREEDKSQDVKRAQAQRYMSFLARSSENKNCVMQFFTSDAGQLFSIKTLGLWHFHLILFYLALLVLFLGLVGVRKPCKMFLDLFTSRTSGD